MNDEHEHEDEDGSMQDQLAKFQGEISEAMESMGLYMLAMNYKALFQEETEEDWTASSVSDILEKGDLMIDMKFKIGDILFSDRNFASEEDETFKQLVGELPSERELQVQEILDLDVENLFEDNEGETNE